MTTLTVLRSCLSEPQWAQPDPTRQVSGKTDEEGAIWAHVAKTYKQWEALKVGGVVLMVILDPTPERVEMYRREVNIQFLSVMSERYYGGHLHWHVTRGVTE